jgi:NAD(P)-dependent dehydrogenase (short-subunit alcohol dehydrogenase family)
MGKAMALLFAQEGADIAVSDINMEEAEKTASDVKKIGRRAIFIQADVSDPAQVNFMVDRVIGELKGVHILVNNAGIGLLAMAVDMTIEMFDKVINTNLRSGFLCSQKVGKWMIQNGGGKILNVASIGGIEGSPNSIGYGPSKAGVINMTRVLAVEWAQYNIRVNCIAPGATMTPMLENSVKARQGTLDDFLRRIPMRRVGRPEEIAKAALFFVSDDSSFVTGSVLPVDGGTLAYGQPTI